MGWLQRTTKRRLSLLRHWNRLMKMSNNRLTKQIFIWEYQNGKDNWCTDVLEIFKNLDLEFIYENFMLCNLKLAETQMKQAENTEWKANLEHKPKLRLYRKIKFNKEPETYVKLNMNRLERSLLAQLRLGILPIEIEVGRYRRKPIESRKCPFCKEYTEDELHFLFDCTTYINLREQILNLTTDNKHKLTDSDKTDLLLKISTNSPRKLAKYIVKAYDKRSRLLNK